MRTTRQMIPLCASCATLALCAAGMVLQPPMQFLDIPPHVVRLLSDLRRDGRVQVIRDDPVNVAVCGDQLEQPHRKGHLLPPHHHAMRQPLRRPIKPSNKAKLCETTKTHRGGPGRPDEERTGSGGEGLMHSGDGCSG